MRVYKVMRRSNRWDRFVSAQVRDGALKTSYVLGIESETHPVARELGYGLTAFGHLYEARSFAVIMPKSGVKAFAILEAEAAVSMPVPYWRFQRSEHIRIQLLPRITYRNEITHTWPTGTLMFERLKPIRVID
jgi:hypothetical protein